MLRTAAGCAKHSTPYNPLPFSSYEQLLDIRSLSLPKLTREPKIGIVTNLHPPIRCHHVHKLPRATRARVSAACAAPGAPLDLLDEESAVTIKRRQGKSGTYETHIATCPASAPFQAEKQRQRYDNAFKNLTDSCPDLAVTENEFRWALNVVFTRSHTGKCPMYTFRERVYQMMRLVIIGGLTYVFHYDWAVDHSLWQVGIALFNVALI